jgi:hypothetical protein
MVPKQILTFWVEETEDFCYCIWFFLWIFNLESDRIIINELFLFELIFDVLANSSRFLRLSKFYRFNFLFLLFIHTENSQYYFVIKQTIMSYDWFRWTANWLRNIGSCRQFDIGRLSSGLFIVLTLNKLFQNPINITIKEETNQIVNIKWRKQKQTDKKEKEDTGRCWGCFFQHICINSTSFWGQSEGISGVNPLSLYSNQKIKWKVKRKKIETNKQTNKQTHRWELQLDMDQCQCEVHIEK